MEYTHGNDRGLTYTRGSVCTEMIYIRCTHEGAIHMEGQTYKRIYAWRDIYIMEYKIFTEMTSIQRRYTHGKTNNIHTKGTIR